ncbi:hypothetical protein QJS66_20620 [Kocuria rhizophila]|nr:hypothetical protein QJS66_20620 [Kocuria rhizophila]
MSDANGSARSRVRPTPCCTHASRDRRGLPGVPGPDHGQASCWACTSAQLRGDGSRGGIATLLSELEAMPGKMSGFWAEVKLRRSEGARHEHEGRQVRAVPGGHRVGFPVAMESPA